MWPIPDCPRKRYKGFCWKKPEWQRLPARRLERRARIICASRWSAQRIYLRMRWSGCSGYRRDGKRPWHAERRDRIGEHVDVRSGRKMKHLMRAGVAAILLAVVAQAAAGQAKPYPSGDVKKTYERLLKQMDAIPLYDNHSHPGFADDTDVDAMASPPDESAMFRLRDDNPEFVAAAKSLFGYPYEDFKPEHAKI